MKGILSCCAVLVHLMGPAAHADAVDDLVKRQMERQHLPGIAIAVIRDGKTLRQQTYGHANLELKVPVTADSVFKIGSVSKQFIASGIMLLVQDGKLGLDDPVKRFLEDAPATWDAITVRHLLTHTSGLVRESPGFDAMKIQSDAEVIRKAYNVPLQFAPGEKMVYCNLGYFILAEIITRASGTRWQEFMHKRVFAPLGMDATRATDMTALVPHRADGYTYTDDQYKNAAILLANRPSGAFLSSLNDLVKWESALHRGAPLSHDVLKTMWQPATLKDGSSSPYGFGWMLDGANGHAQMYHGGSLPGFRAYYIRLPDDRLTIITLTNGDGLALDSIAMGVAAHYVDGLFPTRQRVRLTEQQLDAFVGEYQVQAGKAQVSRVGDELVFRILSLESVFVPEDEQSFFGADDTRVQLKFPTHPDGKRELVWLINGREQLRGPKVK